MHFRATSALGPAATAVGMSVQVRNTRLIATFKFVSGSERVGGSNESNEPTIYALDFPSF
ncbi:hypothetical protein UP06_32755 [Bradyrhizobium sp. LTSP857]|nr:hypothetical protein UP06_32755 [Bradyrhizobium sp. LTSP857]